MKIDRKLNLVIPIDRDDGSRIYVHSTPISLAVFEAHYLVMAKTFAAIYNEGLGVTAGPRVAAMTMKKIAENLGVWAGEGGVESSLVNEMKRLTNVLAPGANGWETLPYGEAVKRGIIDEDEASEVENALAFFTIAYRLHRKTEREAILNGASRLWGGEISSLGFTEFKASLPTSTPTVNTGASQMETASSVPV